MYKDPNSLWGEIAERTLATVDQHLYTEHMLWDRFPKKVYAHMGRGYMALMQVRSDLMEVMFRAGGPRDVHMFFPDSEWKPKRQYIQNNTPGCKTLSYQEWHEIARELDQCLSCIDSLLELLSKDIPVEIRDWAIKYRQRVLRTKMALEPFAQEHLGDRSVLYEHEVTEDRGEDNHV